MVVLMGYYSVRLSGHHSADYSADYSVDYSVDYLGRNSDENWALYLRVWYLAGNPEDCLVHLFLRAVDAVVLDENNQDFVNRHVFDVFEKDAPKCRHRMVVLVLSLLLFRNMRSWRIVKAHMNIVVLFGAPACEILLGYPEIM